MELTPEQQELLKQWNEAKQESKRWSELESMTRDKLVKELFNGEKDEGTETIQLFNGWTLKAVKKLTYNLDNSQGEVSALCAALPESLSKQLVRWKPELSVSTYRKLDYPTTQLLDDILTIKPAKPSLDLIPPSTE